jgi:hypothetical protein
VCLAVSDSASDVGASFDIIKSTPCQWSLRKKAAKTATTPALEIARAQNRSLKNGKSKAAITPDIATA